MQTIHFTPDELIGAIKHEMIAGGDYNTWYNLSYSHWIEFKFVTEDNVTGFRVVAELCRIDSPDTKFENEVRVDFTTDVMPVNNDTNFEYRKYYDAILKMSTDITNHINDWYKK